LKQSSLGLAVTVTAVFAALISTAGCGGSSDNGAQGNSVSSIPPVTNSYSVTNTPSSTDGEWYKPKLSVTWQWQLKGNVNTAYPAELYDVDLFDSSAEMIEQLHSSDKKVICYFSAGSYEDWRPDRSLFLPEDQGNTIDGWPNEKWLDIRSSNVRAIMRDRLDLARQKGCDGVEPDNVDGYANETGFDITGADQLAFNRFIAREAHDRNLSVGLKNDLDQIDELVDFYDFAVNEQCFEYSECEKLLPFINAGKPVLNAEYSQEYADDAAGRSELCRKSSRLQFSTLILPLDLDDTYRFSCQ